MGFNFGAFAGGLAKGGMETYQMMEAIESQKKRDELIALQAQEMKAAGEERAALKEAAGVYNKVGGQDYAPELQRTAGIGADQAGRLAVNTGAGGEEFDRAVNESTQGVLRETAGRQGAALPTDAAMKPSAYTREQADTEYLAKVRGINPDKALSVENMQTQTALGKSSLKRVKAEDDFSEWMQGAQEQAAKDPVGFLKANLGAYNNAKKGSHLDDGNTASVVASADGESFSFVRTDTKGKVVDSTLITPASAGEALKHIAFSKYSSLPGKFKESQELGLKREEIDIKRPYYAAAADKDRAHASSLRGADADRRKTASPEYKVLLEKGNAIADKLNALTPETPAKERAALQREYDVHQVKIANFLGKTLTPKDRVAPSALTPVKDNPGLFEQEGVIYRQDGDSLTPILTPALRDKIAKERDKLSAEKDSAAKGAKAMSARSGGSHAAVDAWKPAIPQNSPEKTAALKDINMRLGLPGISQETEAELLLRRRELLGDTVGSRLLGARGLD